MKKITFGTPEPIVPSQFCENLTPMETEVSYDCSKFQFKTTSRGCLLEFPLEYGEEVFGFGLQLKGFNHKSHKLQLRTNSDPVANTGDSHAPVPFFVTNRGYGMYFDTARYIEVCCGYGKNLHRTPKPDNSIIATAEDLYRKCGLRETTVMSVEIPVAKGIDVYIFEGETITDIVAQYNLFSGGGCTVPEWGLGPIYRCYAKNTGQDVRAMADYLQDHHIPVSIMGLEPGWQSSSYSCSYTWDEERFSDYKEDVAYLLEKGYHINLWEHAFVNATSPIYEALSEYSGDYEVWQGLIPDFSMEQAKDIFAKYHQDHLVSMGIDGFKLDECDNSDFVHDWSFPNCTQFPGGMDGEQYHQLFGTLYMQTIMQALGDTPTLSEVRNAGALAASYPFVLYSDLYDHKDFIRGVVNAGFSGLLWTPEVRDAVSKQDFIRRLQTNVFSVQCIINAWYCERTPWLEFDCEQEVRELLELRMKLVPMLKEAFDLYHEKGIPPIRALVMDYTEDEQTYQIDDQYLFCDKLLVAPMTAEEEERKVYLPQGSWVDYWTKEPVASGWHTVKTAQIPVYERK
ncbi:MAG: glycoside hydrolase [Ruminococcaceae bacterium]|nr:glycoside hydrolase [Oscillospiraceae bacterium]